MKFLKLIDLYTSIIISKKRKKEREKKGELPGLELKWGPGMGLIRNLSRHKKDHIKISLFTKFEVPLLDCNHVEGFKKLEKIRDFVWIWGDAISKLETFVWNLGDL